MLFPLLRPGIAIRRAASCVWPALTLGCGAAGGALATIAKVPLGWLLGSLLFSAALCCLRAKARVPQPWRYAGQLAIGLSAGLSFTPSLLHHVIVFMPLIVLAVLISITLSVLSSNILVRFAGLEPTTAYFGSLPGGVAEMANLAERNGGDVAAVAISQTLRIFLAVLIIPIVARVMGPAEHVLAEAGGVPLSTPLLLAAGLLAAGLAWAMAARRVPNAWLLGGISVGVAMALLHGERFRIPDAVMSVAQILIGSSLGARLRRDTLRRQGRVALVSVCATAALLLGNVGIGLVLSAATTAGLTTSLLSTSPGGLAEMSLTALALNADVGIVTAFHLIRTLLVATLSVPLYALLGVGSRARSKRA